ncbi:pyruvate/2-oxoglutarate dehydrogenase complex dihydrolipoamide dehydrogenase (E3) component [Dyadobacter jejuensis]|uniref:Pyruvate/2-oxoglutarate dehydrogenase complex dihydrolipoamide dehydrogenase (E3) component n=1 Tax=Dyadobacter jejuensis TaxID=1082580 RepID=A0A316AML4_9BACT|nr:mercuric reductase [Dyadobacter jejuensis]PWJ58801.1 pyruvate/2-oxoglutarate dehydrogenase complex dihydrolipoamide dehydrogenase (E3) component [Dyadobacter jejuensis]
MIQYDAIIIGSGQAGTPLSKYLAKKGLKTLLIEKRWVGGTCVNDGCTPTKTMVASAKTAWLINRSEEMGITTARTNVHMEAVIARQQEIVHKMRSGSEKGLKQTENLDLIYGEASFQGPKTVQIDLPDGTQQTVRAETIIINTGLEPHIPSISGLDQVAYLTNTSLLTLPTLPKQLLIVGSGYIGLEFGQMYQRFGSQVTLLERGPRILKKEDEDIAESLYSILKEEGVNIRLNTSLLSVEKSENGYMATVESEGQQSQIPFTHLLLASGRVPITKPLNLKTTGVHMDSKGYIPVDNSMQTNVPGIYALGDIKGGPAFTHVAYDDYRILTQVLFADQQLQGNHDILPYCMFTDPQLGRVGLNEQQAKEKGLNYKAVSLANTSVARAIETGDTRGMMKAIVDADTDLILGASMLGTEGGEVMSVVQMAMMGGLRWQQIAQSMLAHPTFSESLNNLFSQLED